MKRAKGRPAKYGEPLNVMFPVRFSAEQLSALSDVCAELKVPQIPFIREATLELAGVAHLGLGMDAHRQEEIKPLREARTYVIYCTPAQHAGIQDAASRVGATLSLFCREATMRKIGRPDLAPSAPRPPLLRSFASA